MYKNYDNWELYEGFSCGSGTSQQEWIVNNEGQIGLFKQRKTENVTDDISEKIASDIANVIGLPCAKIELAVRNGRYGVVSYLINKSEDEVLSEGITYISRIFREYDRDNLIDSKTGEKYSLEMILKSVEGLKLEKGLFDIFIFDCLIGNSDRHHSNWATLTANDKTSVCPIYDNASSLCYSITEEKILQFKNDDNWKRAQINSKSKSIIRINGKKVTHSDFVKYLYNNYYNETVDFVKKINKNLLSKEIDQIVDRYIPELGKIKSNFIKEFLKEKRKLILNIYKIADYEKGGNNYG